MAAFVSPRSGWAGRLQTRLANAGRVRDALRRLPFVELRSDVRDVVYLNWEVPVARLAPLIPRGVRVVERDGMTVLTILTYAHGHFGPARAGLARRLFPSPLQSNWRLYVESIHGVRPSAPTVLFLANSFDSALYAIGTRLFSDALPSHLPRRFDHVCSDGACRTTIDGGAGSAPGFAVHARDTDVRAMPPIAGFVDWDDAVTHLCLQDAAVAAFGDDRLALARIDLPIDRRSVVPMVATMFEPGTWLGSIGATAMPFCFRVPGVPFRVLSETVLRNE